MGHPHVLHSSLYVGFRRYSLTVCTADRRRWFSDPAVVEAQSESANLRTYVAKFKQQTGYCFAKLRSGARLWQHNYFDRVLRQNDELSEVIAYVVNNPARAKLVDRPADYPYWGSQRYSRGQVLEIVANHGQSSCRG